MFPAVGQWVMETISELTAKCAKIHRNPCMHMEAGKLTNRRIDKLNCSDWYNEMEELIGNVERGKRGTS
jgi:hypothetical protein